MLDIKDFIAETLGQIAQGVSAAASSVNSNNGICMVSPAAAPTSYEHNTREVQFDIALTVIDDSAAAGGGKVKVLGVQLGAEASTSKQNSTVSRIQFSVPIGFKAHVPEQTVTRLSNNSRY